MAEETQLTRALLALLAHHVPFRVDAGSVFVRQGEESDAAFLIIEGSVTVFTDTPYGSVTLATISAPRLIGELGALASLPRTASLRAETLVSIIRIGKAELAALALEKPELLLSVVRQLGSQLAAINTTLALFTNALKALEANTFSPAILVDLQSPPPELADFSDAFHRFGKEILGKRRTEQEMAGAAAIQQSLLPSQDSLAPFADRLDAHALIRPARQVGGDFYDYFPLDEQRVAFIVGDICGKGIPASLFAAMVVPVLRTEVREAQTLAKAVERANAIICRDNTAALFATVFVGVLDLATGELIYANCGHNAPLLIASNGEIRHLPKTGIPLGLYEDRPAKEVRDQFKPGDAILVFTDGVNEANDAAGAEFGDERLEASVSALRGEASRTLCEMLLREIDHFAGAAEQSDDITLMVMRRLELPRSAI